MLATLTLRKFNLKVVIQVALSVLAIGKCRSCLALRVIDKSFLIAFGLAFSFEMWVFGVMDLPWFSSDITNNSTTFKYTFEFMNVSVCHSFLYIPTYVLNLQISGLYTHRFA